MGKCETATASVGIRILLSSLIPQMNKKNFPLGIGKKNWKT
jgi:hypothetical protein